MPTPSGDRLRRVERIMGTAVAIEVRDPIDHDVVEEAFEWFRWVDATFSIYRTESEISRIGRRELHPDDASPEVREVLTCCEELVTSTDGCFQHRPIGQPDRPLDPSGLVKGWSVDRAAMILRMAGAERFCISAGGDIYCGAEPEEGRGWRVGIRHPADPQAIAAVLELREAAVATSGKYERGEHLWGVATNPAFTSVSVVGPELGVADALATAVFVAGVEQPDWIRSFPDCELLMMTSNKRVRWTSGLDPVLRAPRPSSPVAA